MAEKFVFEEGMKNLEEIVRLLERGDAPLDDSLALFERGTKLIAQCTKELESAEKKLKLLVKTEDTPQIVDFEIKEN